MDDEGQARNEYFVEQVQPLQRVAGKQENVITIEVRVRWQRVGGMEYWQRPYVTTVTFAELRRKPDALWMLLTRCLPFNEWKFVDWHTGAFIEKYYSHNATDERLTEEEQDELEDWWDNFVYQRLSCRKWSADGPDANDVAKMKEQLREVVSEDPEEYGILSNYERYSEPFEAKVAKCWFVISAVSDDGDDDGADADAGADDADAGADDADAGADDADADADDSNSRDEHVVEQVQALQRVAGKQEDVITIEVRVRWQKVGGREYWHRPYVTTVTFAELRGKPDALWSLLTRCLPFEEWQYVDWSTGNFEEKLYMENDNDEPLTEEEQGYKEFWWDGFGQERMHVWDDLEYPDRVADMQGQLRELVSEDHGILFVHEHYMEPARRQVGQAWFVISAVPAR